MSEASPAPPAASVLAMITGFMASQAIHVAARLGVADLIHAGTTSTDELAGATRTDPASLHRLLRALVGLGLLEEAEPASFALTTLGATLRSGHPGSLRNVAIYAGGELMWQVWGDLGHSVGTGETAMRHLHGTDTFAYYARHPDQGAVFNDAMADLTRQVAHAVVAVYDFSKFDTIVDVGGGHGTLLAAILAATPRLRGTVFDLPGATAGARRVVEAAGVADRCRIVEGDFFQSVPESADAYLMKSVLHDWNDDRTSTILRNCRRAMPVHARLLVVERVMPAMVDASGAHRQAVMGDLNMLVMEGGRERTEAEYRALLSSARFALTSVVPDRSPARFSILEAVPA